MEIKPDRRDEDLRFGGAAIAAGLWNVEVLKGPCCLQKLGTQKALDKFLCKEGTQAWMNE